MSHLPDKFEAVLQERGLLRDGQRVLIAVSGGLDSMTLLHLLRGLSKKRRWKLAVAHFNHQLRGPASAADARLVAKTARSMKLPFFGGTADTRQFAQESDLSLEMAARRLRHEFLASIAIKQKIPTVALAHHADDQVELFFLRLFRGAGGDGLTGMKWQSPSPAHQNVQLIRPLLDANRAELLRFAAENNISFSEDATNASLDIPRNRIRRELIPLLTEHYQPAIAKNILRTMEVVGNEAEFAAETARAWLRNPVQPFAKLPLALQRRVIYHQLLAHRLNADFEIVERLRLFRGQWIAVSAVCSLQLASDGRIQLRHLEPVQFTTESRQIALTEKGRNITFGGLKIRWQIADDEGMGKSGHDGCIEYFDADKVAGPIRIRGWQPGDRFQPIGNRSASKLQDLFTNAKVPRAERHRRVVAEAANGELFWVEGLRIAENFKLDHHTVRTLKWSWYRRANKASS